LVRQRTDQLYRIESEKGINERNEKIRIKTEQLANRHNLERNALKQKLDTEFNNINKQKDDEIDKINLKYKNRRADLETQQRNEKILNQNENLAKASKTIT
jgi:hypothetical protein